MLTSYEKFILRWVLISFFITCLATLFFHYNFYFLIGLTTGTILSLSKFILNIYNLNSLKLSKNISVIKYAIINFISMAVIFFTMYILFKQVNYLTLSIVLGMFLGISYLSLIITVVEILQSKFIIRNRF